MSKTVVVDIYLWYNLWHSLPLVTRNMGRSEYHGPERTVSCLPWDVKVETRYPLAAGPAPKRCTTSSASRPTYSNDRPGCPLSHHPHRRACACPDDKAYIPPELLLVSSIELEPDRQRLAHNDKDDYLTGHVFACNNLLRVHYLNESKAPLTSDVKPSWPLQPSPSNQTSMLPILIYFVTLTSFYLAQVHF